MNIKDEHTSRLWTFIMKGEIMAFELDDDEMIATRINNKVASWKEVEEYIEKYYLKKDKVREAIHNGILEAKGWGCEDGAYCVKEEIEKLLEEGDNK